MFAKASTFVGSGRPHTFVKCPSASATRKLRRRGGCRKRFPVDLPRVAAPRLSMPVGLRAAARLVAKGPKRQRLRQHLHPHSWQVVGNIAARVTLWKTRSSAKSTCRSSVWPSIVGANMVDSTFPTSHRRTRRHSGPIATVRVIRQRAPILP